MLPYIIRRLFMAVIVILLVTIMAFSAIRLLPGDPLIIFMGQNANIEQMTEERLNQLRHEYGLDKPPVVQYFDWIGGVLHGDLGRSITYRDNVGTLMRQRFPITIHIGLTAFILGNIIGVTLGVVAALRRGTWIDATATIFSYIGITIPVFWLGLLLMYVFGLKLGLLPISGYISPFDNFWESTRSIIMPVLCEMITGMAVIMRQTRSSVLEVRQQDYIRTAWAKGLRERYIVIKHMLKNSLIPVITLLGMGIGIIFGGSVLVETVFAIPGVGRLLVQSVFQQDYVVVQSGVLVISAIVIL
ncbi:MAG: peptide ABC transporter, partial [Chloroflexi bacterium RBG_13_52_12]